MWKNQNPHTLVTGTQNSEVTLENTLAVPQSHLTSNSTSRCIDPTEMKTCPRKNFHRNVYSTIIYNSQKIGNPNNHQLMKG
jgi:hypothetical protein